MKKVFLSTLSLAVLVFGMGSCKKQNPEIQNPLNNELKSSTNYEGVTTDGTILIFDSAERYEKLSSFNDDESNLDELLRFEEFALKMGFPHIDGELAIRQLVIANPDEYEEDESLPDFILSILNTDGAVQIGEYIYRLDFTKELVYVLPVSLKEKHYSDLINGRVDDDKVFAKYSFDEDAVIMVEAGEPSEFKTKSAPDKQSKHKKQATFNGGQIVPGWTGQDDPNWSINVTGSQHKTMIKARYFKGGIHFSLKVKLKNNRTQLGGSLSGNGNGTTGGGLTFSLSPSALQHRIVWQRRYKRKGKNDAGGWMCSLIQDGGSNVKAQSWRGTRRLTHYTIVGRGEVLVSQGNWQPIDFSLTISGCPNTPSNNFHVGVQKW